MPLIKISFNGVDYISYPFTIVSLFFKNASFEAEKSFLLQSIFFDNMTGSILYELDLQNMAVSLLI